LKIYCETSCLPHNIRDGDSNAELAALKELAEKFHMFGSDFVRQEAAQTKDENQRNNLIIDFQALKLVPKGSILHGFSHQEGQYGFATCPLMSDTSDDALRDKLIERGLERQDTSDA
jgi:hypothetical protein